MSVNIDLTSTDISGIVEQLKSYLRTQDRFKDYDFDGSNISVLLNLLGVNTYNYLFYLNMIGNESFLDTALQRDSVVSRAKELNYLPRSPKSATAVIDLTIKSSNTEVTSIVIPKGASFTGRLGSNTFTFTTDRNIPVTGGDGVFQANNISIYEGAYVTDNFVYSGNTEETYVLSNPAIDTSSLVVASIENAGANVVGYNFASSLFDLDSTSTVFFLQGEKSWKYGVLFGDGVIGRPPQSGAVLSMSYRISAAEAPNGCFIFTPDGSISGLTDITVRTSAAAYGGAPAETNASIKYNAPRHFQSQERAITVEDYETLLKINFPEINTVSAYGGEEIDPPQYGRVMVSVDLKNIDGLPEVKKRNYTRFLKPRSPLSIDPVFVEPDYMYTRVVCKVEYNTNLTTLNTDDIRTFVTASILDYSDRNLDDFKSTLRFSNLTTMIDNAHFSIVSNDTKVYAKRIIRPTLSIPQNIDINFAQPLYSRYPRLDTVYETGKEHMLSSSPFMFNGTVVQLQDDGGGIVRLVYADRQNTISIMNVGTVNYNTGLIQLNNFRVDSFLNTYGIDIIVETSMKDITSDRNVILSIRPEDIEIEVAQVRI